MKVDEGNRLLLEQLSCRLADEGKLIEAGWIGMRLAIIPQDTPTAQLDEMRIAFFSGAQHLFGSIMSILEPGDDVTYNDVSRFELIDQELKTFIKEFQLRIAATKGRA